MRAALEALLVGALVVVGRAWWAAEDELFAVRVTAERNRLDLARARNEAAVYRKRGDELACGLRAVMYGENRGDAEEDGYKLLRQYDPLPPVDGRCKVCGRSVDGPACHPEARAVEERIAAEGDES